MSNLSKLNENSNNIKNLVLSAMFLALGVLLPTFTGPQLGAIILPMHIPAILAGFLIGAKYGFIVGVITPILRSVIFGMPPLFPVAIAMALEIGTYGFLSGFLYKAFSKKITKTATIYGSLISAMLVGRVVFGIAMFTMIVGFGHGSGVFTLSIWFTSVFLTSWIGIAVQIFIIPILVLAIERNNLISR